MIKKLIAITLIIFGSIGLEIYYVEEFVFLLLTISGTAILFGDKK